MFDDDSRNSVVDCLERIAELRDHTVGNASFGLEFSELLSVYLRNDAAVIVLVV